MPLDYRLSPDSPLLREGVFERITQKPCNGGLYDAELESELTLNRVQGLTHKDPARNDRVRSLMQVDEYLALLSFPGVVWFVSQRPGIEPNQAAVAVLSGMPWPLWTRGQRTQLLLSVSMNQAKFLKELFQQRADDLSLYLLRKYSFPSITETDEPQDRIMDGWVKELTRRQRQAAYAWKNLARRTRQDERVVCQTVRALQNYLSCLDRYRWHETLSQQEK